MPSGKPQYPLLLRVFGVGKWRTQIYWYYSDLLVSFGVGKLLKMGRPAITSSASLIQLFAATTTSALME